VIILDGKKTAGEVRGDVARQVREAADATAKTPVLAVILVGDDPASQIYVRNKHRACEEVGIESRQHLLSADTTQEELGRLIDDLNADPAVNGILLQLPLPTGLDSDPLLARMDPDKDVDGFHPVNAGRLMQGLPGFRPCTPAGCLELLSRYGLSPCGAHAVVVGRSNIVGRPLSVLLSGPGEAGNATVTLCHSRTPDLAAHTARADFLFAAVGRPGLIGPDMIKPGAVVVDIGMNRTDDGLMGDVRFSAIRDKARAATPVPGGVGPMTIAMLLVNTLRAFRLHNGL
jgi:methylenetetrahydrofolate dehydrogenase (NADP+)/methenyltetrahydrofolate cyclohydrolase